MHQVRLQSQPSEEREGKEGKMFMTLGIHTPGLIRWAKASFVPGNPSLAHKLADSFGIKTEVMVALLTGEVDYRVEGEEVVFDWPCDPNVKEVE